MYEIEYAEKSLIKDKHTDNIIIVNLLIDEK